MINPQQIRAARAMLRWSAKELADKAGVSLPTVQRVEDAKRGVENSLGKTVAAIQKAFEDAGIDFLETPDTIGVAIAKAATLSKSAAHG